MQKNWDGDILPPWAMEFIPARRYKVCYGGWGGGRSWAFARMTILRALYSKIRILCVRELQDTIRDSVHRLLRDQIELLGFSEYFKVGESYIRCFNGSEFLFKGVRYNHNEIKSTERIRICWAEESNDFSSDSWLTLIPTVVRIPGSELWVTFNPDQPDDPTYQRFVVSPPDNALVRKVTYRDNPWFTSELEEQRAWMARTDPDSYQWVWEGECRIVSDAQILAGKVSLDTFEVGKEWKGPYYGADWGFSVDPTAVVRCWEYGDNLYIDHEAWGIGVDIDKLPRLFDSVPDIRRYPIRADNARPETISYMRRQGFQIYPAVKGKGSVEDGIAHLRGYLKIIIHPRCKNAIQESRLWQYKVIEKTKQTTTIPKPGNDHCFDAVRYALEPVMKHNRISLSNETLSKLINIRY